MPQFEVKYLNEDNWKKISERDFLLNLLDTYDQITPILGTLIKGEEIVTPSAIYRIKIWLLQQRLCDDEELNPNTVVWSKICQYRIEQTKYGTIVWE